MKAFALQHKYFLFILSIFIVCEFIVNPIGNFPLNDDWAYGKAVFISVNNGYTIGDFGAMTLFTHLIWGIGFVKIFGFSFTVLRISTLISAIISLFFLNKLIVKISNNQLLGFFACLLLLFNPLYFNLANTYMTDVNFCTLLILCCYFAFDFFKTKKTKYIFFFCLSSIGLVLIRQFGIVVPVCFFIACLFLKEKKAIISSILVVIIVLAALKGYEAFLRGIISPGAAYKFSGSIYLLSAKFWQNFFDNLVLKYNIILIHILIYCFPLAIAYFSSVLKASNKLHALIVSVLSSLGVYFLFNDTHFPFHNILTNMSLGPEVFYEGRGHTYSENFELICEIVKYVFCSFTLTVIVLGLVFKFRTKKQWRLPSPQILFFLGVFGSYIFTILITEKDAYFDRYHLPIILVVILLLAFVNATFKFNYRWMILPLLCFFYVSVFGTKDYLALNRARWEAVNYIKSKANVTTEKVNGGFEVNCWNDGKGNWWHDFGNMASFDYLVQYRVEPEFKLLHSYPFQRYFPYKKDTLNLFMRYTKSSVAQ
ncbi:MAG: glycosyltransferase family 39 protein [Bacteroidetes bacterium]|nr:glycosyltransferase family 39 protein [Bacteroidota bacterium]